MEDILKQILAELLKIRALMEKSQDITYTVLNQPINRNIYINPEHFVQHPIKLNPDIPQ